MAHVTDSGAGEELDALFNRLCGTGTGYRITTEPPAWLEPDERQRTLVLRLRKRLGL